MHGHVPRGIFTISVHFSTCLGFLHTQALYIIVPRFDSISSNRSNSSNSVNDRLGALNDPFSPKLAYFLSKSRGTSSMLQLVRRISVARFAYSDENDNPFRLIGIDRKTRVIDRRFTSRHLVCV